ncbi:MAG: 2-C-methyl-D-erythritol 2,4-cyclodiphosphate synthase [Elusimicrobia bacterium]|jgi:2-C-methyl-D-erythritol 2,4-cyclodiphosphate synthase|nr:2-C-methyl-D-erythritol 2,4-cyclodiphosphate synthase [Elusimicrobiota bacterium]
MRTGIGYDIHRLKSGRELVLGGQTIKYKKGLLGHSDADVVYHSLCDAILGAAALGDIGRHFPDTDPKYKDIDSGELLGKVKKLIENKKYEVNNIDITIVAEEPDLSGEIPYMIENIAEKLKLHKSDINIKATTNEGLGPEGEKRAISAMVVATIIPSSAYDL